MNLKGWDFRQGRGNVEELRGPLVLQIAPQRWLPVSYMQKICLACGVQVTFQTWGVLGSPQKHSDESDLSRDCSPEEASRQLGQQEGKLRKVDKDVTSALVLGEGSFSWQRRDTWGVNCALTLVRMLEPSYAEPISRW